MTMMDLNANSTIAYWRPPLVQLTHMPLPGMSKPYPCYIAPDMITLMYRSIVYGRDQNGQHTAESYEATVVVTCHGTLSVFEEPHEVARRREAALGTPPPVMAEVKPIGGDR